MKNIKWLKEEGERKFYVRDDKGNILLKKVTKGFGINDRTGEVVKSPNVGEVTDSRLTEKEIKDYDPNYWVFRKPVEGSEEQKYYVLVRDEEYGGFWYLFKNNNGGISIGVARDCSGVDWDKVKLTEQEIKDYGERYWEIAKPVDGVE